MYGNPSLSKLCRKNPIRNVVGWYKRSFMVYFVFWLSWFWLGRKFFMKRAKTGPFLFLLDTPTPRRRSACLGVELRLGEPEPRVSTLFGPPRCSSSSLRRTSSPKHSIASPRHACKSCFGSSLLLILTIIHWINEDPIE